MLFCDPRIFVRSRRFFISTISTNHGKISRCTRTLVLSAKRRNEMVYSRDGPGTRGVLPAESGKLPVSLVPSRSTKAGSHVAGRRRKRRACPYQGVRHGINGQHGGLRKALFRRKGDEARNYGFAFIEVDEGPYRRSTSWMGMRGVWFIGDYDGDIGTYAFCLTFAESLRWKLSTAWSSGKYENGFTVRSSRFSRTQITARRDDRERS